MNKKEADHIIATENLHSLKSKADFPQVWYNYMGLERMADKNGPFDAGCTGPGPHIRFVAGAVSDKYGLIIYEQGGIAYFHVLELYAKKTHKVEQVYRENLDSKRLTELENKLKK